MGSAIASSNQHGSIRTRVGQGTGAGVFGKITVGNQSTSSWLGQRQPASIIPAAKDKVEVTVRRATAGTATFSFVLQRPIAVQVVISLQQSPSAVPLKQMLPCDRATPPVQPDGDIITKGRLTITWHRSDQRRGASACSTHLQPDSAGQLGSFRKAKPALSTP